MRVTFLSERRAFSDDTNDASSRLRLKDPLAEFDRNIIRNWQGVVAQV